MDSIRERYLSLISRMVASTKAQSQVSDNDVYQQGIEALLPSIDTILEDHLLPGSRIDGLEHIAELYEYARRGEPCLLLLEHYSNFDLPAFHYLLRKSGPEGQKIANDIVAIAGIKLNESNPMVNAFTRAYTRIVIFPSRSIEIIKKNLKDPNKLYREIARSVAINHAAMKTLSQVRESGKIILVFPAGTRYRPWDPNSKRGVREIASYIKSFSKFCLVAVNGNILRINPSGEMEEDLLHQDRLVYTAAPVEDCKALIAHVKEEHHFRDDKKQEIVDHLMGTLEEMHEKAETTRLA